MNKSSRYTLRCCKKDDHSSYLHKDKGKVSVAHSFNVTGKSKDVKQDISRMEKEFFDTFSNEITKERLSVYSADGCDNKTVFARYLYNIELCKSLYPSLNIFEIAFGNSVDKALQQITKTVDWFDKITLNSKERTAIDSAKEVISNRQKIVTHNRIIAELTLGFWISLFSQLYAQESFQSSFVTQCFNTAPKTETSIVKLRKNLKKIRILRNRVFHYERIIHWKDLKNQHEKKLP